MPPERDEDQQETSLRDDLEAAIESAETDAGEVVSRAAGEENTAETRTTERPREEQEQTEQAETARSEDEAEQAFADAHAADEAYPDDAEKYPKLTKARLAKPPEVWRPAAREGFANLPEPVRREIHRREIDNERHRQENIAARQSHEAFTQLTAPYASLIAAEGAKDPLEAVDALLKTTATLALGTPQQKAARITQLINHYNIDVDLLDEALSGALEGRQVDNKPDPVQQLLDQRLAPIEQMFGSLNSRVAETQAEASKQVEQEITKFANQPGNEFFSDVRHDMADLMELAAKNNRPMTMEAAYKMACDMNPEVTRVIARRNNGQQRVERTERVERKLNTAQASRPSGQLAQGMGGNASTSLREDLMNAIDQVAER